VAVQLANHVGYPYPEKAYLAGLIHDACKALSPRKLAEKNLAQPAWSELLYYNYTAVWHALVAPDIVKQLWNISDKAVLSAIKWHTTGRYKMSLLDTIVFVADSIEPRRIFPTRTYIESLSKQNLDHAAYAIVLGNILSLLAKGNPIHPYTLKCRDYYLSVLTSSQMREIWVNMQ
jgi:predicted HD superfamily hydrolase involved in NAD metabolism